MLSPKNKEKLIRDVMSICDFDEFDMDSQVLMHNALMKDTTSGKLYKYRVVDDKSLECLKKNTLYCASPISFNDPFDSKLGISFQSFYRAKFDTELDRLSDVFEKFLKVYFGNANLSDFDKTEQRIIRNLLDNKKVMEFVTEKQGQASTLEEVVELLHQNSYVIIEILQTVLQDESFNNSIGILSDMLPRLIENTSQDGMLVLYKEDKSFEDFAKANGIDNDDDEISLTLLLGEKYFPDKHDSIEKIRNLLLDTEEKITKRFNELFRIICLSTDYKNNLMWSHYGNSHRGFCIEYDFSNADNTTDICPFPVIYSKERPTISWKAFFNDTPNNNFEASLQLMLGLLTKDNSWRYENEWRILTSNDNDLFLAMPSITCVYLGANISNEDKKSIIRISDEKGYQVKQMALDRGTYKLHAIDI